MFAGDAVDKGKALRERSKKNRDRAAADRNKKQAFIEGERAKKEEAEKRLPDIGRLQATPESAMASLKQQRLSRLQTRLSTTSALLLQSFFRRVLSNASSRSLLNGVYDRNIATLLKFTSSLPPLQKKAYAPPPATVSSLTSHFLFFATGRCSLEHANRLGILCKYVLSPGVASPGGDLHPLLPWLQTAGGRRRITRLLRCLLDCLPLAPSGSFPTADMSAFLSSLLSPPSPPSPPSSPSPPSPSPTATAAGQLATAAGQLADFCRARLVTSLHLLSTFRGHLLSSRSFGAVPACPIPSSLARSRATGALFSLALACSLSQEHADEHAEFASQILTVPSLPHKLSDGCLRSLASPCLLGSLASSLLARYFSLQFHLYSVADRPPFSSSSSSSSSSPLPPSLLPLLTLLAAELPLATFSARATVFWVSSGRTNTALVIPDTVTRQAKGVLTDTFLRTLSSQYFVSDPALLAASLDRKTPQDLEDEKAAEKTATAAEAAEADARPARKQTWFSKATGGGGTGSSWAAKLANAFSSSSKKAGRPSGGPGGGGVLVDTSEVSRRVAEGGRVKGEGDGEGGRRTTEGGEAPAKSTDPSSSSSSSSSSSPSSVSLSDAKLIAPFLATIIARWGGTGSHNISTLQNLPSEAAVTSPEPSVLTFLNVLCFSTDALKSLWAYIISPAAQSDLNAAISSSWPTPLASTSLSPACSSPTDSVNATLAAVMVFANLLSTALMLADDSDVHAGALLPVHQLRRVIVLFKRIVHKSIKTDSDGQQRGGAEPPTPFGCSLVSSSAKVLRSLHDRSGRRPLCASALWLVDGHEAVERSIEGGRTENRTFRHFAEVVSSPLFRVMPFGVPLKTRLKLFERLVTCERREVQGVSEEGTLRPGLGVRIMRGRVLEDGIVHMNRLGKRMKERLMIQYINEHGMAEDGIDVGGLFKDFWSDLSTLAFSPGYALFVGADDAEVGMHPSPVSRAAHGQDHVVLFEFLGRILGKALFEGITIQPVFAHFFLSFIRGGYDYNNMLADLGTKDRELHKNLMFLKNYGGDAEDLCLTMSVTVDDFGEGRVVDLVPGGAGVDVTNGNKLRYIHLVAKHHMSDRIKVQSEAFARGLWEVIPRSYLRLFNEMELRVLISGADGGAIDVEDMRKNCRYGGGFTGLDRNVGRFWEVVEGMTAEERRLLMKFVTSCERPPPLGFASLNPPFSITRVGITNDNDALPAASTCFNVLKLPTYSSGKVMKKKILLAITSGCGFETA